MKEDSKFKEYSGSFLLAIWIPAILVVLWAIGTNSGALNNSIFPTPQRLFSSWKEMILSGKYLNHVLSSFGRVFKGFFIGSLLGITTGTIIGLFAGAKKSTVALIGMLRPIPAIALIPLFILSLGIGETSKVAVITLGSFWPILINTIAGLSTTDPKLLEVGTIFDKSKREVLFRIIFPSAAPYIFTGLRLGVSSSWTCVVAAEMIAASSGIGYLISYGREMAQPATLFIGVFSMGIFGLIIELLVINLQKKAIYWVPNAK
ncbi:sulfonate transport system permease protein [Pseudobutyrivibrio sp. ACV-2]|uniref:ABC transporter permease n=1 Tax=Pseudobutyrivibrio sp. ACV-2 TaxID=1520801 RepID=UPI000899B089|nr:ABC transporter permease [Pseudobutyrivibrio sp. ACV-2]SEA20336.1 sulfonate transport system permease protein [Pseudobutyrivibrio sp. ACV-2]